MDLSILSREAAERYDPEGLEVCISIADPDAPPARLSPRFAAVLRLAFSDIVAVEMPADVLFATDHAAAVVEFMDRWRHAERLVVVEQWFSILQRKRLRIVDFHWSTKSVAKVMATCTLDQDLAA